MLASVYAVQSLKKYGAQKNTEVVNTEKNTASMIFFTGVFMIYLRAIPI